MALFLKRLPECYQRLEHWVKGYDKARYRKCLKWYMMYANHNQPGAHSVEDQIAVTKCWIDNYFKTPEYYKIDGKLVVCYWSADNLDRDFIAEATFCGGNFLSCIASRISKNKKNL